MTLTSKLREVPSDDVASRLRDRLEARTVDEPDFWSFSALRSRTGNHALFQYPAMMVPELQGALLDDLIAVQPDVELVYDPFAGSGTVMLESLYRGLDFHGSDINPLAILLCQVKADPPTADAALSGVNEVLQRIETLHEPPAPDFAGVDKWFKPEIKRGLALVREAISQLPDLTTRRFLWVCMAETIRLVSNSRISTFKLHAYTEEEIARRESDAVKAFGVVARQNVERLKLHWARMLTLDQDKAAPTALLLPGSVSDPWIAPRHADILMTSPPYGDNKTTVPYGQHSYLPLQWIAHSDIPGVFDGSLLDSTHRIDLLSLGGSLKHADVARDELCEMSPALDEFLSGLGDIPPLRKKVLSFVRDYRDGLKGVRSRLVDGAFCFFTLGERRVGKRTFPLVEITRELLLADGHEYVTTIERVLPGSRKRMAAKNSEGSTMAQEWILITRSWAAK
ncbi:site-specific DNA-methyltransferase [Microbacterium aurugineum]|uniref:site-specific DNA-methyltransferase n=1 Tax=Microbacterium aurugineum TaxID=2851642 RepID=UPI0020C1840D|nr:site-specific DNA-methyltransferase [Microbacterium aurugineum]MCK8478003.1 site-specific DNA-methyltransferase [Microbacterium aurugineum]